MDDDTGAGNPRHQPFCLPDIPGTLTDDQREHRANVAYEAYQGVWRLSLLFPCAETEALEAAARAYLERIGEAV